MDGGGEGGGMCSRNGTRRTSNDRYVPSKGTRAFALYWAEIALYVYTLRFGRQSNRDEWKPKYDWQNRLQTLKTHRKEHRSPLCDLEGQIDPWSVWSGLCCHVGAVWSAWSSTCFLVGPVLYRSCTTSHNCRVGSGLSRSWSIWYICPRCEIQYPWYVNTQDNARNVKLMIPFGTWFHFIIVLRERWLGYGIEWKKWPDYSIAWNMAWF